MKKLLPVFIALTVAILIGFMVLRLIGGKQAPPPKAQPQPTQIVQAPQSAPTIQQVDVFVVSRDIATGTKLTEQDIDIQPWPEHLLIDGFITTNRQDVNLVGMVTRAEFREREPLIMSKLVNPDDPNFLAGGLPSGKRAVTIATDGVSSVAGFVFPGDRVDVLVTHEVQREDVSEQELENARGRDLLEEVTETLLTNIRVLAVDQSSSIDVEEGLRIPSLVTLEVTPEDSQRMRLAETIGSLSLALRSIEDKNILESIALTRQSDLTQADVGAANSSGAGAFIPVTVVRGTEVDDEEARQERLQQSSGEFFGAENQSGF